VRLDLHNRMVHPPAGPPQQQRILVQSHGGQDVAMMQSTLSQMNRDNGEFKNQLMEQHDVILSLRRDLAGATARLSDVTGLYSVILICSMCTQHSCYNYCF